MPLVSCSLFSFISWLDCKGIRPVSEFSQGLVRCAHCEAHSKTPYGSFCVCARGSFWVQQASYSLTAMGAVTAGMRVTAGLVVTGTCHSKAAAISGQLKHKLPA